MEYAEEIEELLLWLALVVGRRTLEPLKDSEILDFYHIWCKFQ